MAGLTQEDLAQRLGKTAWTIWAWETGKHEPKMSDLREIARICGVSVPFLLGE